jgi:hypothetical protein
MHYEKRLRIKKEELDLINLHLTTQPESKDQCFGEDKKISHTVRFENGIEMDIQLCGVQFKDGESNLPWTQAVLYEDGKELTFSDSVGDEFIGEWYLSFDGNSYVVHVEKELAEMNKEEFLNYIEESFFLSFDAAHSLLKNILDYIALQEVDLEEQRILLTTLLKGIDLEEYEISKVRL